MQSRPAKQGQKRRKVVQPQYTSHFGVAGQQSFGNPHVSTGAGRPVHVEAKRPGG